MLLAGYYAPPTYTLLRTLSAVVAESTPPAAGAYTITLPNSLPYAEFLVAGTSVGGTVSPTIVIWEFWRLVNTSDGTQISENIGTLVVSAASIATPQTVTVKANSDKVWATVRFLDGTLPTATGKIYVRSITEANITKSDLKFDENGYPIQRSLAYDSLTGADKTVRLNDLYPPLNEVNVISETSRTSGTTYYFPADTGIDMGGYDALCMQLSVTGAGASVATVTAEASLNGTVWEDITLSVMDDKAHAYLTSAVASTAGGNLALLWSAYGVNWQFIRIKFVVTGASTGAVSASFRRAKLGT